jgi:hypothetical protein
MDNSAIFEKRDLVSGLFLTETVIPEQSIAFFADVFIGTHRKRVHRCLLTGLLGKLSLGLVVSVQPKTSARESGRN